MRYSADTKASKRADEWAATLEKQTDDLMAAGLVAKLVVQKVGRMVLQWVVLKEPHSAACLAANLVAQWEMRLAANLVERMAVWKAACLVAQWEMCLAAQMAERMAV